MSLLIIILLIRAEVAWPLGEDGKAGAAGSGVVPVEALAVLDEEVQLLVRVLDDVRVQLHPVVYPERPWRRRLRTRLVLV